MKSKIRSTVYLAVTVLMLLAVGYLDSIPNHRFGYGDYSLWLSVSVFPLVFFLYGILSGVILNRFKSVLYFTVTPIGTFAVFALTRLLADRLGLWISLRSALLGALLYFALSFVGFGLYHLLKYVIRVFAEYNKMHGSKDA